MKLYTLGFAFSPTLADVLLVRKTRPDWQFGKYNGIGGHMEPGEPALGCMVREFKEETGLVTSTSDWITCGRMDIFDATPGRFWKTAMVHLFSARLSAALWSRDLQWPDSDQPEVPAWITVKSVLDYSHPMIANIPMLVAYTRARVKDPFAQPALLFTPCPQ